MSTDRMLKKSGGGVLASLRGSTYRSVRLTSSLAAALLDSLFEHSEGVLALIPNGNFWPYFWPLNRPCSSREAYERRVSAHPRHVLMDEASGRSSAPGVSTKARPVDPSAACRRSAQKSSPTTQVDDSLRGRYRPPEHLILRSYSQA